MNYRPQTKAQRKVVLLVEDSPTQALGTQAVLEECGLTVVCAINGIMGIQLAYQVYPDAIVLDVQMPDLNGFQVCEELKKDPETAKIPIIMLTRQDTPESFALGMQAGAIDFIPKDPFAMAVLRETLRQMGLINTPERKDSDSDKVD